MLLKVSAIEAIGPLLIILFIIFLWIKTLVEIAKSTYTKDSKMSWLLIVLFLNFIGTIIYYAEGQKMRIKEDEDSKVE